MFSDKNPEFISQKLDKELDSCSEWLIDNRLSLHLGNTECILLGPKRKLKSIIDFQSNCNGHRLKSKSMCSIEYFGIDIDKNVSSERTATTVTTLPLACWYISSLKKNITSDRSFY